MAIPDRSGRGHLLQASACRPSCCSSPPTGSARSRRAGGRGGFNCHIVRIKRSTFSQPPGVSPVSLPAATRRKREPGRPGTTPVLNAWPMIERLIQAKGYVAVVKTHQRIDPGGGFRVLQGGTPDSGRKRISQSREVERQAARRECRWSGSQAGARAAPGIKLPGLHPVRSFDHLQCLRPEQFGKPGRVWSGARADPEGQGKEDEDRGRCPRLFGKLSHSGLSAQSEHRPGSLPWSQSATFLQAGLKSRKRLTSLPGL